MVQKHNAAINSVLWVNTESNTLCIVRLYIEYTISINISLIVCKYYLFYSLLLYINILHNPWLKEVLLGSLPVGCVLCSLGLPQLSTLDDSANHGGGCDEQMSGSLKESGGNTQGLSERQNQDRLLSTCDDLCSKGLDSLFKEGLLEIICRLYRLTSMFFCVFFLLTMSIQFEFPIKSCDLPENFLGSEALEVCTHRVKTLKCGLHTQGPKHILWAHFVEVKGHTSYVFPIAWLAVILRFQHKGTLEERSEIWIIWITWIYTVHSIWIEYLVKHTGCGLHVCPGSRAMSMVLSGKVMRNSSESTSVPSSSQTRDRDTADKDSNRAWQTWSTRSVQFWTNAIIPAQITKESIKRIDWI